MEEEIKPEKMQTISGMEVGTNVKIKFTKAAYALGPISLRDWILQACHEKCDRQGVKY